MNSKIIGDGEEKWASAMIWRKERSVDCVVVSQWLWSRERSSVSGSSSKCVGR